MQDKQQRRLALLALGMLALAMLACGGFQVRGAATTPTATRPRPTETTAATASAPATAQPLAASTPVPTAEPTKAASGLAQGARARVAVDAVNVRADPKAAGARVGSLTNGTVVTLRGGPVVADNFTWYQVDNGAGLTGWVATGPADAPWLVPAGGAAAAPTASGPHLVQRQIKVGDLVQVTTQEDQVLTVRDTAGKNAEAVARVKPGTRFTVKAGPTQQDGLTWWQLEGEQVKGWAADGDGQTRWLTAVEQ